MNISLIIKDFLSWKKIKSMLSHVFWFVFSIVITRCNFILDSKPFGIALLGVTSKNTAAIFAGSLVGALFSKSNSVAYVLILIFLFILRMYFSSGKMNETEKKRLSVTSAVSVLMGVEDLLLTGFDTSTVIASVSTVIFSSLFAFLFCLYYSENEQYSALSEVGLLALSFSVIYSLNKSAIFGFQPAVILAYCITIVTAMKHGFMKGGITGIICGLASGASAYVYTPILGIIGIISGVLFNFSDALSMCSVLFVSLVYGMYSSNMSTVYDIFKNCVTVIVIFSPLVFILKRKKFFGTRSHSNEITDLAVPTFTGAAATSDRIDRLAKTYKELAEIFTSMGKHQTSPTASEISEIIKAAMFSNCEKCSNLNNCTYRRECLKTVIELSKKYIQNTNEIPISRSSKLPLQCNGEELIKKINTEFKKLIELKTEKDSCSEAAENMLGISKALSAAIDEDSDLIPNPEIAAKVSAVLSSMRIRNSGVYAQGKQGISVFIYDVKPKDLNIGVKALAAELTKECKVNFATPKLTYDSKRFTMHLIRAPRYKIERGSAQICKGNNTICGDSICSFYTPSQLYNLICDGMGSGPEAAATSRMACIMTEKLISSGCSAKLSVETLNKMLIRKFDEVFTTLDMLSINFFTGEATIYKAAAATTLIFREGKCYDVSSRSVPVGIVDKFNPEITKMKLLHGDTVLMISDGVTDCFHSNDIITDLVGRSKEKDASAICEDVINLLKGSGNLCDDASVICLKIALCDQA